MLREQKLKARELLRGFKQGNYAFGNNVLNRAGEYALAFGSKVLVITNQSQWLKPALNSIVHNLEQNGLELAGGRIFPGARSNTPQEDVYRLETYILHFKPDCLLAIGGGSTIDAVKAANVLAALGEHSPGIETYFGTGQVSQAMEVSGKKLLPLIAVETAASSGAHLTKYANVTDAAVGQKKLIVDEAIIPDRAVFDYTLTKSASLELTLDGAFDGLAHCLEVFYGAGPGQLEKIREIALTGIELITGSIEKVMHDPGDEEAREAIGLGTDLGGYAIMVGGTNGAHLTSFSLVDVTSHGRACAIMNPYYTVFYAPAVQEQLRLVGNIFLKAGLTSENLDSLAGRDLGIAVARAMTELSKRVGFPTKLSELPGFRQLYIRKALEAAKDPQLAMKLKNMPVALNASLVDEYMEPVLEAAVTGDFDLIKNLEG